MLRRPGTEVASSAFAAAPFPAAIPAFVGRAAERARTLALLEHDVLALVYGVPGIGKSELVYKLVEDLRGQDRWKEAPQILVRVPPRERVDSLAATLRIRVAPASVASSAPTRRDIDLAAVAHVLDRTPHLIFLDDLHNLEDGPAEVGRVLGYLARHVRSSRILAASRVELPMAGAPLPVVVRLGALDAAETADVVGRLAARLGIEPPDAAEVFRRSGGSPFYVQRELAAPGRGLQPAEDSLDAALRDLRPAARRLLLLAAVMRGQPTRADLVRAAGTDATDDLYELASRFLVDVDRELVIVHDLVRDALVRQAAADELASAHRRAALLHFERSVALPGRSVLDLVEAVRALVAANDSEEAWASVEQWYGTIAAAGVDHLLLDELAALADRLPSHRLDIEILSARILVRRSRLTEAQRALDRAAREPGAAELCRYHLLASQVTERTGDLAGAEVALHAALERARGSLERFHVGLELAILTALRGDGLKAHALLDRVEAELDWPSARHRGRLGFARTLAHASEDRFELAARAADRARAELRGQGLDDLVGLLGGLEAIVRVESDELAQARGVVEALADEDPPSGLVRADIVGFYRGVVAHGEGDARAACEALAAAFARLSANRDSPNASVAGYYLAGALGALGDVDEAITAIERAVDHARQGGLGALVPHGVARHAGLLCAALRMDDARRVASQALGEPRIGPRAVVRASCVLARVAAYEGRPAEARRQLDAARTAAGQIESTAANREIDLEDAEVALLGGDAGAALAAAEAGRRHHAASGRRHEEALAAIRHAQALVARAGPADLVLAEAALRRGRELAGAAGYSPLRLRGALVEAALARRRGDGSGAQEILAGALRAPGSADDLERLLVKAALQVDEASRIPPGARRLLALLDLIPRERYEIITRGARRVGGLAEVELARSRFELVVMPTRGAIFVRGEEISISGRPVASALLAYLVARQGECVNAETLYREVWRGSEYHPLHHRNAVYVAVNRLRRTLRRFFPARDLVKTLPGGWCLGEDLGAACVRGPDEEAAGPAVVIDTRAATSAAVPTSGRRRRRPPAK